MERGLSSLPSPGSGRKKIREPRSCRHRLLPSPLPGSLPLSPSARRRVSSCVQCSWAEGPQRTSTHGRCPATPRGAKGPLKGLQPALVCEPATACHFYFINPASRACSPGECGLGLSSGLTGLGPVQEVRHEPEALCPVWKLTARFLQGCRRLAPTEKLNKQQGGDEKCAMDFPSPRGSRFTSGEVLWALTVPWSCVGGSLWPGHSGARPVPPKLPGAGPRASCSRGTKSREAELQAWAGSLCHLEP